MAARLTIKRGLTFGLRLRELECHGPAPRGHRVAVPLVGVYHCELYTDEGALVAKAREIIEPGDDTYRYLDFGDTSAWPLGLLHGDIVHDYEGVRRPTVDDLQVMVVRNHTQLPPLQIAPLGDAGQAQGLAPTQASTGGV